MLNARLFIAQRLSALIMAPLVIGHIAVMIYAIQSGLSSAEILGRTRGSIGWLLFYGAFVVAVSIHGAIGLRVLAHEVFRVTGVWLEALMYFSGAALLLMGGRAVLAVTIL